MKKVMLFIATSLLSLNTHAAATVAEGKIEKIEPISSQVGSDGKPLLAAGVGVGIGSAFGSGSGNDAAKVAGGLLGARLPIKKNNRYYMVGVIFLLSTISLLWWIPGVQNLI